MAPVVNLMLYQGENWTSVWKITEQKTDLTTGETTTTTYYQMSKYLENQIEKGEKYEVYKYQTTDEPDRYELVYYLASEDNRESPERRSIVFRYDGQKLRETFWEDPLYKYEIPFQVGKVFSDNGTFTYYNLETGTLWHGEETTTTKVISLENISISGKTFESFKINKTGLRRLTTSSFYGAAAVKTQVIISYSETSWFSEAEAKWIKYTEVSTLSRIIGNTTDLNLAYHYEGIRVR